MRRVRIGAKAPYDVLIQEGILDEAGRWINQCANFDKAAVITDDAVSALYGDRLMSGLLRQGIDARLFAFPEGENSKNPDVIKKIYSFLMREEITRGDIIIAFGGGVPGDVAGFAAATYLRGLPYVQIPTTLISQTDSSVGGKTAVNLTEGKNLMGQFHQPLLVICDPGLLNDPFIIKGGVTEVIKYGLIADEDLFSLIEQGKLVERLEEIIERCVSIKGAIVSEDEYDRGKRQLLNLGHTFGHGVEKLSKYSITHGMAVGIGTAMMLSICVREGILDPQVEKRFLRLLKLFDLPASFEGASLKEIASAAVNDKKRTGDDMNIVVCEGIGKCRIRKIKAESLLDFVGR